MIYSRYGAQVTIVRKAVLEDIQMFEHRQPNKQDEEAIAHDAYVIVAFEKSALRTDTSSSERLYPVAALRADGGSSEIVTAIAQSVVQQKERHTR